MNQELFIYFTTDNISGKKCTEKWLSKNSPKLYNQIINWCDKIENIKYLEFKRKVYHYINNLENIPNCKICKGEVKYSRIRDGYRTYCSDKCVKNSDEYHEKWKSSWIKNNSNGESILRRKKTAELKYGNIENYKKLIRDGHEKSIMNKYGVKSIFELSEFKNKRKKTLKEKYGSETYNNSDKTRNTRINNKTQIDDSIIDNFLSYKKVVVNRTITVYRNNIELVNPLRLKRSKKDYHIDHKFSIKQAFLIGIPIEIITHPCNLHLIYYKDNLEKQDNCWISIDDLLLKIMNYDFEVKINHSYLNEKYKNIKSTAFDLLEKLKNR